MPVQPDMGYGNSYLVPGSRLPVHREKTVALMIDKQTGTWYQVPGTVIRSTYQYVDLYTGNSTGKSH